MAATMWSFSPMPDLAAQGGCEGCDHAGIDCRCRVKALASDNQRLFNSPLGTCLCRCGDGEDEHQHWFAQLRLVFSCTDEHGMEHRCAFVHWLCQAEGAALPMQRLKWALTTSASGAEIPWYDVINVCSIERPVLLQADPTKQGFFYYNKYVGR